MGLLAVCLTTVCPFYRWEKGGTNEWNSLAPDHSGEKGSFHLLQQCTNSRDPIPQGMISRNKSIILRDYKEEVCGDHFGWLKEDRWSAQYRKHTGNYYTTHYLCKNSIYWETQILNICFPVEVPGKPEGHIGNVCSLFCLGQAEIPTLLSLTVNPSELQKAFHSLEINTSPDS